MPSECHRQCWWKPIGWSRQHGWWTEATFCCAGCEVSMYIDYDMPSLILLCPKGVLTQTYTLLMDYMDQFLLFFITRVRGSDGIPKPSLFYWPFFPSLSLLHHVLSEPELGNNMSTIQELCKRLLSRRPNLEPILSKQLLQLGTNLVVETSGSISNEQPSYCICCSMFYKSLNVVET